MDEAVSISGRARNTKTRIRSSSSGPGLARCTKGSGGRAVGTEGSKTVWDVVMGGRGVWSGGDCSGTLMIGGGGNDEGGVGMHGGRAIIERAGGGSVERTTLAKTGFVIRGGAGTTPARKGPAAGDCGERVCAAGGGVEEGGAD